MSSRLVIFGAGDIARLAHHYFTHDSPHTVAGFAVDSAFRKSDEFLGLPLVDAEEITTRFPPAEYGMFVALSYAKMNAVRAEKYEAMKAAGYRLASYVSSRCSYLSLSPPGDNCFILEDNTIQPFVTIDDHCFITSHVVISGYVHVGTRSFIGVNATLRNSITIAPETLIGAGAIIMKSTKPKEVYMPERAKLFPKPSDEIEL